LKKTFELIDKDHDGVITVGELQAAAEQEGLQNVPEQVCVCVCLCVCV
jgi:Ca2+-binding EF-hand superfamily protein